MDNFFRVEFYEKWIKWKNAFSQEKRTAPNKKIPKSSNQAGKKFAASSKGKVFNQDVFWDELKEVKTTWKIILPEDDIDFLSDSDSDGDGY